MRWYIIKALLSKEVARHAANRGGIAFILLLVAASVLLSVFAPKEAAGAGGAGSTSMVGGVNYCFIEFDRATPLVKHLQANVPAELQMPLKFRELANADTLDGIIVYPTGTAAIQIRQTVEQGKRPALVVRMWHPPGDPGALATYEAWFWKECRKFFAAQAREKLPGADLPADPDFESPTGWQVAESHARLQERVEAARPKSSETRAPIVPDLSVTRDGLGGKVLDFRGVIATGMVLFALYFTGAYLLPTLNCEERERGVLLAQALSPASPAEILAAKFLFYPVLGIGLAAVIAGIYKSAVLSSLFFWLALFGVAGGFLGIGMTIAALARTQRSAFLGGMCYLLSVSMVLMICSINGIPFVPYAAVEYHGPRILHAALTGDVYGYHWGHLVGSFALAGCWLFLAGWLFRRRGWQ
jgi:hypothetical protein